MQIHSNEWNWSYDAIRKSNEEEKQMLILFAVLLLALWINTHIIFKFSIKIGFYAYKKLVRTHTNTNNNKKLEMERSVQKFI